MYLQEIDEIFNKQKEYYSTQITKDVNFRINQLDKLKSAIQ